MSINVRMRITITVPDPHGSQRRVTGNAQIKHSKTAKKWWIFDDEITVEKATLKEAIQEYMRRRPIAEQIEKIIS